jgi:phosphate starvation-inducible PhoH-like protein
LKHRNSTRKTKQDKVDSGIQKVVKEKFHEERYLPPLQAKSDKQKHYLKLLNDPNIQIIVAEGLFGTGKSFCAAVVAADKFRTGEIEKIIVSRPYIQTGKTAGFRPGDTLQKLYPYVRNILDTVKSRLGPGAYHNALKDGLTGEIEVQATEDIRGRSFDQPSILIIDECQQCTIDEVKSIVTRISDNCKLILCGDDSQKDIKGQSGLIWFKEFAQRHSIPGVGFVNFNEPEDIVRGGMVRHIAYGLLKDSRNE